MLEKPKKEKLKDSKILRLKEVLTYPLDLLKWESLFILTKQFQSDKKTEQRLLRTSFFQNEGRKSKKNEEDIPSNVSNLMLTYASNLNKGVKRDTH